MSWKDKAVPLDEPKQASGGSWKNKAVPLDEPTAEPESERGGFTNALSMANDRFTDLGGNFVQGVGSLMRYGGQAVDAGFNAVGVELPEIPGMIAPSEALDQIGTTISDQDFGYTPEYTIDRAYNDPSLANIAGAIGENAPAAVADMIGLAANPVGYGLSRNQEIAEARAENNGRGPDASPTAGEFGAALPWTTGSILLDRLALKGNLSAGADGTVSGLKDVAKETGRGITREGGTEFVQEGGLEYAGESVGTEKGWDYGTAVKRGVGGAMIGGPVGGGLAGANAAMNMTQEEIEAEAERLGLTPEEVIERYEEGLGSNSLDDVIAANTGTDIPAPPTDPKERAKQRRATEQSLGEALSGQTDVLRRDDIEGFDDDGNPIYREGAQPAQDPNGRQANPETLGYQRSAENTARELGLSLSGERLDLAARDIQQGVDPVEAVRSYSPDSLSSAFSVADARRQRRDEALTGEGGTREDGVRRDGFTQGRDYQAAGSERPEGRGESILLLDAKYDKSGKLVAGEQVFSSGDAVQGKDGKVSLRVTDGNGNEQLVPMSRVTVESTPKNPRLEQDFGERSVRDQAGVGTQTPGPRERTDSVSTRMVMDPDNTREASVSDVLEPEPQPQPEPQGREGGTYENGEWQRPTVQPEESAGPQLDGPRGTGPARPGRFQEFDGDPRRGDSVPRGGLPTPADADRTGEVTGEVEADADQTDQNADQTGTRQQVEQIADQWENEIGDTGMAQAVRAGLNAGLEPTQQTVEFQQKKLDEARAKQTGTAAPEKDSWTLEGVAAQNAREKKDFEDSREDPKLADLYDRAEDTANSLIQQFNDSGYSMSRKEDMPSEVRKLANKLTGLSGTLSRASKQGVAILRGYKRANPEQLSKTVKDAEKTISELRSGLNQETESATEAKAETEAETEAAPEAATRTPEPEPAPAPDTNSEPDASGRGRSDDPVVAGDTVTVGTTSDSPTEVRKAAAKKARELAKKAPEAATDRDTITISAGPGNRRTNYSTRYDKKGLEELARKLEKGAKELNNKTPPSQAKGPSASATDTTIKEMLEDGEIANAREFAQLKGKEIHYVQSDPNDGRKLRPEMLVSEKLDPAKVGGIEGLMVGQSNPPTRGRAIVEWVVFDPQTGRFLGKPAGSKAAAIKNAAERVKEIPDAESKIAEIRKNNPQKKTQEELEKEHDEALEKVNKRNPGTYFLSGIPTWEQIKNLFAPMFVGEDAELRAWATQAKDLSADMRDAWNEKTDGATKVARRFYNMMVGDLDRATRALADKYDSPTLSAVADVFHHTAGGKSDGHDKQTLSVRRSKWINKFNSRFAKIDKELKSLGLSRRDRDAQSRIYKMLENPKMPRKGRAGELVTEIEKLFKDVRDYQVERGIDVGYVEGYVPRWLDRSLVAKNPIGFKNKAAEAYRSMGSDPQTAKAQAAALYDAVIDGDSKILGQDRAGSQAGVDNTKPRKLTKDAAAKLDSYWQREISEAVSSYINSAIKRGEVADTEINGIKLGDNAANWTEIRNKIQEEDPSITATDLESIEMDVAFHTGLAQTSGRQDVRTASSWIRTIGAMTMLDRVAVSAIPELTMGPVRATTGNPIYDMASYAKNAQMVFTSTAKKLARTISGGALGKDQALQDAYDLAEYLGATAGDAISYSMQARMMGEEPASRGLAQVADKYYRNVGLTQLNDFSRVTALRHANRFMAYLARDHARNGRSKNRTEVQLRDLGIKRGSEGDFSKWYAKNFANEAPTAAKLEALRQKGGQDKAMADAYDRAVHTFVDQAIQRPDSSTRPRWADSPLGAMVFQLLNFTWAFQKNVINRAVRTSTNTELDKVDRLLMGAGFMSGGLALTAMAAVGNALREEMDEQMADKLDGRPPTPESDWRKAEKAVSYSGLVGRLDPALQLVSGTRYDRSVIETIAGPTLGTIGDGVDQALGIWTENSDNTNTAERSAMKALHQIVVTPAMQTVLAGVPLAGPAGRALVMGGSIGGVRATREPFIDMFAGEEDPKLQNRRLNNELTGLTEPENGGGSSGRSSSRGSGRSGGGRDAGR